jgi:hypothetical protein
MRKKRTNRFCKGLLNFYKEHLKPIPWVHGPLVRIYVLVWPLVSYAYYFIKAIGGQKYKQVRISSFVISAGVQKQTILPAEKLTITRSRVYPVEYQNKLEVCERDKDFPEILIATIPNAEVIGGSNMVFSAHTAIKHDLFDSRKDCTSEELHRRYIFSPTLKFLIRNFSGIRRRTFQQAACFTDACSGNYAHWLTEVLPRIYLFTESGMSSEIRMIIDRGLHPNLMESFHVIAGENPNVFKLGRNRLAAVESLSMVSCAGYVPFGRRSSKTKGHSYGRFSPATFKGMVNKIRRNLGIEAKQGWRKLYIRRNSSVRTVSNLQEIESILIQQGFEFVEPEQLTFAKQVKLFSEAGVIVGATGAAMANLIFCSSLTKIIVMMGIHDEMPYAYWQNMASAVGNNVSYVLGKVSDSSFRGIHANFRIETKDLLQALELSAVV